jgi:hypothetical protein
MFSFGNKLEGRGRYNMFVFLALKGILLMLIMSAAL